jgi:hypothetical protein
MLGDLIKTRGILKQDGPAPPWRLRLCLLFVHLIMMYIELGSLKLNGKVTWGNSKYRYMGLKNIHVEDYQRVVQSNAYFATEMPMCRDNMLPKQMQKNRISRKRNEPRVDGTLARSHTTLTGRILLTRSTMQCVVCLGNAYVNG